MQPTRQIALSRTTLAWREFGDPAGAPLFFFHGWPGSSAQSWLIDGAARRHGFRGFAMDRPGIGASPFMARKIVDWPSLVREFAAALGLAKFSLLGVSGGGPYALACAAACPNDLVSVTVACGAPPIAELDNVDGLHPAYRFLLRLFRRRPAWVRFLFQCARPVMLWPGALQFFPPLRFALPEPDANVLADPAHFAGVFGCQSDAFCNVNGLFADAALYAEPWGFRLEDVRMPVQFWHGRNDAHFHYTLAQAMAARVPRASLRIVENEGHFSLPINQAESIVAAMEEFC
jgi:pimeloyl-ACP methyl ester carboxylesterase